MTLFSTDPSSRHAIVRVCVVLALLALPFVGALHCQVMHDDHGDVSSSRAEACCVFLCFTAFVGMTIIPAQRLTLARAALNLKPVRLTNHFTHWVPPPRPIGPLA